MSWRERVSHAIMELCDKSGSSLQAIKKQLQAKKEQWRFINAALKSSVSKGTIIKNGGKYLIVPMRAAPKKKSVKKVKKVKKEAIAVKTEESVVKKKSKKKSKKIKKSKKTTTTSDKAEKKALKLAAKTKAKAEKALFKSKKKSRRPVKTIKVAGVSFKKNGIRKVVNKLGEVLVADRFTAAHAVTLKKEPSNPYDRNAIAVYINGTQIGYVPRSQNRKLSIKGTYLVWSLRYVEFLNEYTCTIALMPPSYNNPTGVTITGNQIYF